VLLLAREVISIITVKNGNCLLFLFKENDYWMGMKFLSPGGWKWSEINEDVTFFDWAPGEPNRDDESCAIFGDTKGYRWADVDCYSARHILCEMVNFAK
jgi:hypothetical protein